MSGARLHTLLPELTTRQPVMVLGAAVIDVIADAYALPWRGCDIELKQQSVNVGGCALNIAVALKRLGIEAGNALPLGQGVWAEIIRNRMAKEGLISLIDNAEGDNGWCLALVEPDGERTFMSFSGVENQWNRQWLARLTVAPVKRRTKNAKAFHDKCENFSFRASNETAVLITAFYSLHGDHLGYG